MQVQEHYSEQAVNETLDEVLQNERMLGMYAPLFKRITIYIDKDIPKSAHDGMTRNGRAAMAANSDSMQLYIDRDYLYAMLNAVAEMYRIRVTGPEGKHQQTTLYDEIRNILVHELTHLLCQHSQQGRKKFAKYVVMQGGDAYVKDVPHKEWMAWMAACEVEANRGFGIKSFGSPEYWSGITDEYTYPKVRSCKYLEDIYQTLLREYGDELEKDYDEVAERAMRMMGEEIKEEKKEGNQNGEQQGGENGTEGGNESSDGEGDEQDGTSEGQKSGDAGESQKGSGENGSEQSSSAGGAESETERRLQKLAKMVCDQSQQITERQFDPDLTGLADEHRTKIESSEGGTGASYGIDQGGDTVVVDTSGKTIEELLESIDHEYRADIVERALAKMKGSIEGSVARERVSTYSRQARRDGSDGLLKKGTKRAARSVPKVLVALDKSGSMNGTTTAQATEAIAKIFDITGRPTQGCWICLHDGAVKMVKPFKQWKSVVDSFYPSGGNDFGEVIRTANKLGVDVVLNVGDAGDYLSRSDDKEAVESFVKAGRRWIDVGITNESRRYNATFLTDCLPQDYAARGILREWLDMTGGFELSNEEIIDIAKRKYPAQVARLKNK